MNSIGRRYHHLRPLVDTEDVFVMKDFVGDFEAVGRRLGYDNSDVVPQIIILFFNPTVDIDPLNFT